MHERTRSLLALSPLLLAFAPLRQSIESSMPLHMLIEFPALLAAGWAAGRWVSQRWPLVGSAMSRLNALGLLSLAWLWGVASLWMVPAALDLALLDAGVAGAKVFSWWFGGVLLAHGTSRWAPTVALFGLGNLAWMFASAGMIYQSLDVRLCVSYLQDEQIWTGRGLVVLSIAIVAWLVLGAWRKLRDRPVAGSVSS